MMQKTITWLGLVMLFALLCLPGCTATQITYEEATFKQTTFLVDKRIDALAITRSDDGSILVELNGADSKNRLEWIDLLKAVVEAAP